MTTTEATIAQTTRLRNWPNKRPDPPPQFRIKKIGLATLRRAVKKMTVVVFWQIFSDHFWLGPSLAVQSFQFG